MQAWLEWVELCSKVLERLGEECTECLMIDLRKSAVHFVIFTVTIKTLK